MSESPSHLHLISAQRTHRSVVDTPLQKNARHLQALLASLACDGGERLLELTDEDRGSILEHLEELAGSVHALTGGAA
jgi:hypothetical protein